ncbi:MAG TPA: NAD/NADP octopine/nopaline dehydrogenase family protein [Bacteroidales bacterium]|nr:NAD/NADP octopine/nopaline dehydrogenase family protein [Bacteroidales bacterium]
MKTFCVCGGGSMGHVISAWLSAKSNLEVNVLTSKPHLWHEVITISTPNGKTVKGKLSKISSDPADVIPQSDIVLLCLPGFLIREKLCEIKPYLNEKAYVGSVFSSSGFFFEALKILEHHQPIWGFQRVPFISRVNVYGKSARLLGFKEYYNIAIEHVTDKQKSNFTQFISDCFDRPTRLLNNYYEASLTNSNPLLHTSRLYSLFGGDNEGKVYPRMILFYEEFSEYAADLLIKMDTEFFNLLSVLPVSDSYLPPILDYYESHNAETLAAKLRSIESFKGIISPMKETKDGWVADYSNRYFTEDFPFGLHYIWELAHEKGIQVPNIDMVYEWGIQRCNVKSNQELTPTTE